ncbi:hypothetical protein AFM18_25275 [Achromobacter spanius]|uniref:Uncharacterized protein n=1 Tax=Achromobacter spanius TaxID=217203 RepID=A0AAW3HZ54_9BURK|nr:hypothetical protein AFM18_25275 [Achromobacter spanius]
MGVAREISKKNANANRAKPIKQRRVLLKEQPYRKRCMMGCARWTAAFFYPFHSRFTHPTPSLQRHQVAASPRGNSRFANTP